MAERIGPCVCPICGRSESAHQTLAKNGWVCITCNGCRVQVQCRGDESDDICRTKWPARRAGEPTAPATPPTPPKPAPEAKPAPAPTQPEKTPPAARTRAAWGWDSW